MVIPRVSVWWFLVGAAVQGLRVKQLRLDYEWGNIQCVAAAVIIIYGSL